MFSIRTNIPGGSDGEGPPAVQDFIAGLRRSPGEGSGYRLQCSCRESHRQSCLAGYSPQGHKELDATEQRGTHAMYLIPTVTWHFICVDFKMELGLLFWYKLVHAHWQIGHEQAGKYLTQAENHSTQRNLLTRCANSRLAIFPLHISSYIHALPGSVFNNKVMISMTKSLQLLSWVGDWLISATVKGSVLTGLAYY